MLTWLEKSFDLSMHNVLLSFGKQTIFIYFDVQLQRSGKCGRLLNWFASHLPGSLLSCLQRRDWFCYRWFERSDIHSKVKLVKWTRQTNDLNKPFCNTHQVFLCYLWIEESDNKSDIFWTSDKTSSNPEHGHQSECNLDSERFVHVTKRFGIWKSFLACWFFRHLHDLYVFRPWSLVFC